MLPTSGDVDVSCYLGSVLSQHGLSAAAVIEQHPGYWVARFPTGVARGAGYGVIRAPESGSERPLACDPAHALLTGTPRGSKTKRGPARLVVDHQEFEVVIVGAVPVDPPLSTSLPEPGADQG
jgi:hypothetical protein